MNARRVKIRLQNRFLALVVGVLLLLTVFHPYKGWLTLLIAFGGALGSAYLWVRSLAGGLGLKRAHRFGWAQVGDRLEEQFTLSNDGLLPAIWVDIDYFSDLPGYAPGRATGLGARDERRWVTAGTCNRRGQFALGPLILRTGDPLGIFQVEIVYPSVKRVLVTPPVIPLEKIGIVPGGRTATGRPRRHALERREDFSRVRVFSHGDSFRDIHWRTTARKDELYVRVMENNPASDWWVILDLQRQVQVGKGEHNTEEHGVILANSLCELGLHAGKSVGLVTQGPDFTLLKPEMGESQRHSIRHTLALAGRGDIPLETLLAELHNRLRHPASLVLITPNPNPAWADCLASLSGRRIQPTVLLLEPLSYETENQAGCSLAGVLAILRKRGIPHKVFNSDFFAQPAARPGKQGQWVWRSAAANKAIPVSKPAHLTWHRS